MSIFGKGQLNSTFEKTGDLVYLFAKDKIKMNSTLTVAENQVAYVMVNDRITDEFLPGSYTLSVAVLPISTRALKLQKKMNNAKGIIKSIVADLYIISKETASFENINSFNFVVKDKQFGRVETNLNFSCQLKVANPLEFLSSLRKFVAVVKKGMAVKLLKEFSQEIISSAVQKMNIQISSFMKDKEKTEEIIFEKFVEKMQNIGIEVISFSMNKINLKKRMQEAFGDSINLTMLDDENIGAPKEQSGPIVFERVGLQGEGDRKIEATVIQNNESKDINEVLNVDPFENFENKPKREFRINLGDNSILTSSGIENISSNQQNFSEIHERDNLFERRREERNIFGTPNRENSLNDLSNAGNDRRDVFSSERNIFARREENVEKHTCKNCGKVLSSDDEFCSKCGTKVEK